MAKKKITARMWRVDPQKHSRVMDQFGRTVASVGLDVDPNLIAAAPDMFELLERLEAEVSIPKELFEEVQTVLGRARGDFGVAIFSRSPFKQRSVNKEWLEFMQALWKTPFETEQ
jgi:hypothetical protein